MPHAPFRETRLLRDRAARRWGSPTIRRWLCVYCGAPATEVDHFYPYTHRDSSLPHNLVPACGPCNRDKSNTDPVEWMTAVGVPPDRIAWLLAIYAEPTFRATRNLRIDPVPLTYRSTPRR
ncbi:HNH endonuclease [Microcella alkalica]|uniref:HNH endonuclease n=1 Tax=Microcella alkalica TaxID=355930 RepID=UPI00145E515A